jgi:thioredoxin-related protein
MKIILFSFFLMLTGAGEWLDSLETAKEIAARENKLILLNFSGSDWCGPCIKMKKEVFENEAFLSIAEKKLVLVRADFPRSKKNKLPIEQLKRNEALAEKYNPLGKFPYTVLVDATGKVLKEWDGYTFASQDTFIHGLEREVKR